MQTFTAEQFHGLGLGRQTFALEFDKDGQVVVHTVKFTERGLKLREKNGDQLYGMLYGWIDKQFPTDRNKNFVIMGFSGYDPATKKSLAHTALGGGGMGLFSSLGLWTWPESIRDVPRAFLDVTPIDTKVVPDDSAYRGQAWSMAATTLGACIHEMGHTFGLPHTKDPFCVMSRGFDHFNRVFVVTEQTDLKKPKVVKRGEEAYFSPYFAQRLIRTRWFQPDARDFRTDTPPTVQVDWKTEEVLLKAPHGLAFVGTHTGSGEVDHFAIETLPEKPPTELRLKIATLREQLKAPEQAPFAMVIVDRQGNELHVSPGQFSDPRQYVRGWHLLAKPRPWTKSPAAPVLTEEDREGLVAELKKAPLTLKPLQANNPFLSVDLRAHYPQAHEQVVTYGYRNVVSDKKKEAVLLLGGDDGFRVWLNGKLVVDHSGIRVEPPRRDQGENHAGKR